ncbi:MFS family permease [Natronocella acetinitrilica]|uniref:MFS family permease n=1 Tax=Natronocella acetinitrilica TaxID=414046 RepID=A0AAE3KC79_9GAMM|nr:MFS transporter [Natronocella acetinitrilica]MCP1676580.1 MFS family permease [Natronocella acetinitrilica]
MQPTLTRIAVGLASIVGLRMFGLFLVLPVLAIYGPALEGATPALLGLALGAYGATQAIFQIPLGWLSDRFGRKPVIVFGLLIFLAGSVLAAVSDGVWGVIIGRALQGAGAIAAAVLALAADLTPPEKRSRVMAAIGITIGAAFIIALVLGPLLAGAFGLAGLFWVTAALAVAAIVALLVLVPDPPARRPQVWKDAARGFREALADRNLLRLNVGIGALNFSLTALFLVVPLALVDTVGLDVGGHWRVYLPVLLCTIPVLALGLRRTESAEGGRRIAVLSGGAVALSLALLAFGSGSTLLLVCGLWLFFSGFNLLEACLPALTSRYAQERVRGSALGVYATYQFAGAFLGGVSGGIVLQLVGVWAVLAMAALAMTWATFGVQRLVNREASPASVGGHRGA